tara:strand:+ start:122 stop:631 length:510 start_codon:yes stop_codon:yes gene_type:complete
MATESDGFLKAEEAVVALLENVSRLQGEIEGYSQAKVSLEEVHRQLVVLVGALGGTAELSESVLESLRDIGTPEILRQLSGMNQRVSSLEEHLSAELGSMKKGIDSVEKHLSAELGSMKKGIDSVEAQLEIGMSAAQRELAQQAKAIKVMILLGLIFVTVAVSAVVFLV